MENYKLIAECIQSGQLSARQVEAHLEDELFFAWYKDNYGN